VRRKFFEKENKFENRHKNNNKKIALKAINFEKNRKFQSDGV